MRDSEWEKDTFDELLHQALASDDAPSDDFTARLMEQVRRTPQERVKNRPYRKILAAAVACVVIAVAIPLAMPRMGSTADSAAATSGSEASQYAADESGEDLLVNSCTKNSSPSDSAPTSDSADDSADDGADNGLPDENQYQKSMDADGDGSEAITLTGTDAQDARALLEGMSISPASVEETDSVYALTAEQAAALGEQIDALNGVESACTLILEDNT